MDIENLRFIIRGARQQLGISVEEAAEKADISPWQWHNLEMPNNTRRTSIRLPADTAMMGRVAETIGRDSCRHLLEEAGLL